MSTPTKALAGHSPAGPAAWFELMEAVVTDCPLTAEQAAMLAQAEQATPTQRGRTPRFGEPGYGYGGLPRGDQDPD